METLIFRDTQKLLHAIEQLYSLNDLNSFGTEALAIVHQLVENELPIFTIANPQALHCDTTSLPDYQVPSKQQSISRCCLEEHRLELIYQQDSRPFSIEDQMSLLLTSDQAQSWEELGQGNITLIGFLFHRGQRNFSEHDCLILNLLRPHLFQAYSNAQHHHQLQQNLTQLQQDLEHLNLITLNASGQIQSIGASAIHFLQNYFAQSTDTLHLPDRLWDWVRHQISSAPNNSELPHARLPLRVEQNGKQLVIRLITESDANRYLLLLEEQTLSLRPLLEQLGLSARETEVLFWVIWGKDNQSIANHLGIHISTVRKHLESIFHKLGVNSRTEAVALALEKLGILH